MTRQVMEAAPLVTAKSLCKSFGDSDLLKGIDLEIRPNEFVALLGRSGSGKTTLLRILAGMERPDTGTLAVPPTSTVVFQEPRLMPWMRAWENVTIGIETPDSRSDAAAVLAEVGLPHRIDAWPSTLSGGEAQRVALARALVRSPSLILLDEPFAALDAITRAQMQGLVYALYERHRPAVLLVTHDIDEALLLADRIIILQDGQIAESFALAAPHPRRIADPVLVVGRQRVEAALGIDDGTSAETEAVPAVLPAPPLDHRRRDVLLATSGLAALGVAGLTRGLWGREASVGDASSALELRVGRFRQGAPDSSFFSQAGVADIPYRLRYVDIPSSNELLELITSGAVDIGISANIPPIFSGLPGGAVKQIAAITTDPAQLVLLARSGSGIDAVSDIQGRRIGYLPANTQHYFLLKLLARHGLGFHDIVPVALSASDAQAAFERGDIDAWAAGGWIGWDAAQKGATVLASGKDLIRLDLVVLANAAGLKQVDRRDAMKDYLRRISAVWRWSAQFPAPWGRENARLTGLPEAFFANLRHPQFTLEPANRAAIDAQQDIADTFLDNGAILRPVDVRPFWDATVLK